MLVWRGNNQFFLIYIHLGLSLTILPLFQSSKHKYDYGKEANVGVEEQQLVFTHLHSVGASL